MIKNNKVKMTSHYFQLLWAIQHKQKYENIMLECITYTSSSLYNVLLLQYIRLLKQNVIYMCNLNVLA